MVLFLGFDDDKHMWDKNGHPRILGGQGLCLALPMPAWWVTQGAWYFQTKIIGTSLFFVADLYNKPIIVKM